MLRKGEIWMADWVAELRRELTLRAITYAQRNCLPHFLSKGGTIFFEPYLDASGVTRHGNFFAPSYQIIRHDPEWAGMLNHGVANANAIPRLKQGVAMETDSSCSTAALAMSLFCLPEINEAVASILKVEAGRPRFAGEIKSSGRRKKSREFEPDIILNGGGVYVWAVLTESLTGAMTVSELEQHPSIQRFADLNRLAVSGGIVRYADVLKMYLTAQQNNARFVLIIDQRRQDLAKAYRKIMQAAKSSDIGSLLTWQDLAKVLPGDAKAFVQQKYGIEAGITIEVAQKQEISLV
jgi:hypothetical protein